MMAADVICISAKSNASTTSGVAVLPCVATATVGSYQAKHFVEMQSGAPSVSRMEFVRRPLKSITYDRIVEIRS